MVVADRTGQLRGSFWQPQRVVLLRGFQIIVEKVLCGEQVVKIELSFDLKGLICLQEVVQLNFLYVGMGYLVLGWDRRKTLKGRLQSELGRRFAWQARRLVR
jgi:hypothetical protein